MRTNYRLKITYCNGLRTWILDWNDADQNFMIRIPLLTRHDAGVGMVPYSPMSCLPPVQSQPHTKLLHAAAAVVSFNREWAELSG